MSGWFLYKLPALCAWIALLELDAAHAGQFLLSRPLLMGPVVGLLLGDWKAGVAPGALIELFWLQGLPAGAARTLNGTLAAAVAVIWSAGPLRVPPEAALPAALACGALFPRIQDRIRARRARLVALAREAIERGEDPDWDRLLLTGLGTHALAAGAFVYAAAAAGGPLLLIAWFAAPFELQEGLRWGYRAVPWIGLAVLLHALGRRR